jgi:hypothetical protein
VGSKQRSEVSAGVFLGVSCDFVDRSVCFACN